MVRIVVIGGGYGGVYIAKNGEEAGMDVTVVTRTEELYHKMSADRACVVPGSEPKATFTYEHLLTRPDSKIIHAEAREIDVQNKQVLIQSADFKTQTLEYDYLVLAIGMRHSVDIGEIPSQILTTEQMHEEIRKQQDKIANLGDRIAVIGGGPAGCELAGEIKTEYPEREVLLAHSRDNILSSQNPPVSQVMQDEVLASLATLGVQVRLGKRMSQEELEAEGYGVLWATGLSNHPDTPSLVPSEWTTPGDTVYFKVGGALQIKHLLDQGITNVFAVGDSVGLGENKQTRVAGRHARFVCATIAQMESTPTQPIKDYEPWINPPKPEESKTLLSMVKKLFRKPASSLPASSPSTPNHAPKPNQRKGTEVREMGVLNITMGPIYHMQANGVVFNQETMSKMAGKTKYKYQAKINRMMNIPSEPEES